MKSGTGTGGPKSCTLYARCEYPLCHLPGNPMQVWYSEGDICKNPQFKTIMNSMRKLKRKAALGHFTLTMLNREFVVRKGIQGIDADLPDKVKNSWKEYERTEKTWQMKHPEISKEREEFLRIRGNVLAQSRKLDQKSFSDSAIYKTIDSKGVIVVLALLLLKINQMNPSLE